MSGRPKMSLLDRVEDYIVRIPFDGCWHWVGACTNNGYPRISYKRRACRAHRVIYEAVKGPITARTLDHLCKNTYCVNPDHLEPVSLAENILRSDSWAAKNKRKTHCPKGHPYAGENLRLDKRGYRKCVLCQQEHQRRAWAKYVEQRAS